MSIFIDGFRVSAARPLTPTSSAMTASSGSSASMASSSIVRLMPACLASLRNSLSFRPCSWSISCVSMGWSLLPPLAWPALSPPCCSCVLGLLLLTVCLTSVSRTSMGKSFIAGVSTPPPKALAIAALLIASVSMLIRMFGLVGTASC